MTAAALAEAEEIRRLREQNAILERFVGQAAHDLQEPLRLLQGYLDLLTLHLEGRHKLDAPKLARDAKATSERMGELLAGLLEHARAQGQPMRRDPLPLALPLADAMANMRLRMHETGAQVTHGPLPILQGDRGQLTRLFQNLLDNSLKYARERAPVVHVASERTPEGWVVTFDDNGPGFPREGRDRVFEPFTRLHPHVPGAGLGLAGVRAIVERMGGTIEASDAPGGGARIRILFRGSP